MWQSKDEENVLYVSLSHILYYLRKEKNAKERVLEMPWFGAKLLKRGKKEHIGFWML